MNDSLCSCGAMLPLPDLAGLVTCPSCGRVTRVDPAETARPSANEPGDLGDLGGSGPMGSSAWPAPPVAAPDPSVGWGRPSPVAGAPQAPVPPGGPALPRQIRLSAGKGRAAFGCIPVIVMIVVTAAVLSALRGCDTDEVRSSIGLQPTSDVITLGGSATLLDLAGDGTDLVVVTQELEGGSGIVRRLARVRMGGESARRVWQSEPLEDDAFRAEVAVVGEVLFAGLEDQLLALELETGETRWRARMSDTVTFGCPTCFAAVGDALVVRTADAYVSGYSPASSEQRWSRRLNSTVGSMSVVAGQVLLVDDPEDPAAATPVQLIDPATGRTVRSLTPSCPQSEDIPWTVELGAGDLLFPVAGSDDVVAAYGFGDGCATRWNPSTGAVRWSVRVPEISSFRDDAVVVGPDDLVVPTTADGVVAIALADGTARSLTAPAENRMVPNIVIGRTLLADTSTTRGTTRYGLVAFDLTTGERLWSERNAANAQAVSRGSYDPSDALFDDAPRQVLVPDGERVWAMVFDGETGSFRTGLVDPAAGPGAIAVERAFVRAYESGTPTLTVTGVDDGRAFVTIDSLLQAIPGSGRGPIVTFPEAD